LRSLDARATMNDSLGFRRALGASPRYTSAGMERLFDLLRLHLQETGRGRDPHQAARLGEAAMEIETARLWVDSGRIRLGSSVRTESAGPARGLRQSCASCSRGGGSGAHATRPAFGRASGLPSSEPDRAHIPGPRDLSSSAGPGPRAYRRSGMDSRTARECAGSVAMTADELLTAAQRLPFRPVREALEDRPLIVVAPHPDDESLGCGGLIAAACRQGLRGKVIIVSDGAGSHPYSKAYPPDRLRAIRQEEAKRAGAELGLKVDEDMLFLGFPDRFVPSDGAQAEHAIDFLVDTARESGAGSFFCQLAPRSPL
jgi:GlcNAc-PI de-N-acetylase